jgi:hypothetical protein
MCGKELIEILACYAIAFPEGRRGLTLHASWALEISDHAAGRLLQRSANASLRAAAQQAALAFASASAAIVQPLIGTAETVYLPTGTGVFVGHVIGGITTTGRPKIYYRARTWLPAAWLNADHRPLPASGYAAGAVATALWHWHRPGAAAA